MIEKLRKNIILLLILCLLLIIIFFVLGLTIKNWPYITLNRNISITEVVNTFFTFILAFLIPLYIKYYIDKGIKINEIVINEIERYRVDLDDIHGRFLDIYRSNKITKNNKSELIFLSEILDSKFEILNKVVNNRCKNASDLLEQLKSEQIKLWKIMTGSEINSEDIDVIHPVTFKKEMKCHSNIIDILIKMNSIITNL